MLPSTPIMPAITSIVVEAKNEMLLTVWPISIASDMRISRLSSARIHSSRTWCMPRWIAFRLGNSRVVAGS